MAALVKRLLLATLTIASFSAANPVPALLERQGSNSTSVLAACPGYKASHIQHTENGLTATLTLAGTACNAYGTDLTDLTLTVEYQTDQRLHVKIQDAANQVYQVPSSVFERPASSSGCSQSSSDLIFRHKNNPFSFTVTRRSNGEVLFDTSAASLVFESQYLRLRTNLPENPSLYGLGEHTDPFMLNTTNYTRTIWNRDAYEVPPGTNLYGDHPVYFDHRGANGTHGVFLLNSNGMNIVIDNTNGQYLEYNTIGGILDFYFMSGPSPVQVAQQYSEVVGKSAMMPYWGFGFHQCRYGMQDVYEVAEVVANYSQAGIPLETMWTDIDYMYLRRVFTLDPDRFPLDLVQQLVTYLHTHQQHYIVMVDPAVAYQDYPAFNDGVSANAFLTVGNGSVYKGVVWPGVTAFPDWFAPGTQGYWDGQFDSFFDPTTGVDIDALWIDMNEASNFCVYPCADPEGQAASMGDPPRPPAVRLGAPRPIPGFPADFQPQCKAEVTFNVNASTFFGENIAVFGSAVTIGSGDDTMNAVGLGTANYPIWSATIDMPANTVVTYQYLRAEPGGTYIFEASNRTLTTGGCNSTQSTNDTITTTSPPGSSKMFKRDATPVAHGAPVVARQASGTETGLPGRNLIDPEYTINNVAGSLSNKTLDTDLVHYGGWVEYDTHNLYGAMMSEASRLAMLSRRPTVRPMVITRSTFAGSGRQVGHWLGDNAADWSHYLISIAELLEFGALFQLPMVGSDVCGYAGNTNELLCARWATLGAFSPFYRNHGEQGALPHEFYRWPLVAEAARNAIATRYQLLDYFYTAFYEQNQTGTPSVQPMFFVYPEDGNTNALQYQYFFGPAIMVAPVTDENSTTAEIYMPNDVFYDFYTHEQVQGTGSMVTLDNVPYTTIPLYYKGGSIVALRAKSTNTTTELRNQDFSIVIAPSQNGTASGALYLDDGNSLVQTATSYITFTYSRDSLVIGGSFGYQTNVSISSITVLGGPSSSNANTSSNVVTSQKSKMQTTNIPLTGPRSIQVS
ncbi:glycoside hydrolase family 31 protein [Baudoinia panamericana UAMH 10762]|uniref:Glycoside hydrolase family 31 protein n=1 Tax=Baudoinia panamericana (strain UAMH 10762) TaxID=717646 RepID=M2MMF5_BAUPA|nr:glycoside hydrolase family 31 protein [Baudoinia panamericana UAMH 10762]EMC97876.1 glycoside hydrolase family 31 protein [Baudoinia panamericana UAMH 10762]